MLSGIKGEKRYLEVILRTHSGPNVHGGNRVSDAFGGKPELMVRSLRTLVSSLEELLKQQVVDIRLTVFDDHSLPGVVSRMREILAQCSFKTQFFPLGASGNGPSLRACYDFARTEAKDLIYFVEDDYLHEKSALQEMVYSYFMFGEKLGGRQVGIFPVDYIHLYEPDRMRPTRLVPGSRRHWRTVEESTCTFLISKKTLDDEWHRFVELTENGVIESTTINAVWRERAVLFSPVPTLAIHLHHAELLPVFSDWKRLWDSAGESSIPIVGGWVPVKK